MKKHFILAAMATTALLAGCSNEEENLMPNAGAKVSFVIDGPVTRTTTDANGITSFAEGDEIGMYSEGLFSNMAATIFTVGSNGNLTAKAGGDFTFNGTNPATFYAYYPTSAQTDATSAEITIQNDQSTNQGFNESDFMTVKKASVAATANPISLEFKHRLALVKVELKNINATAVTINGVQPTATWTFTDDAIATTGTAININMWKNGNEFWAVIPAQSINASTELFSIRTADKTYVYKPTSKINFTEGNAKKFTLGLAGGATGDVVALGTIQSKPWGEWSTIEEGNVEEYVKNYITLNNDTEIAILKGNRNELTETSPWGLVRGAYAESTVTNNNGTITITTQGTGQSASWYNRTLYYYCSESLEPGEYTLSFDFQVPTIDDTTTDNNKIQISLSSKDEAESGKYKFISSGSSTIKYEELKDTNIKSCKYTFNTNQVAIHTGPTGGTLTENTEAIAGFYVTIGFMGTNTFNLSNFKLTKN